MEYLPSRFGQRIAQLATGCRRVPWQSRRVLRSGTIQRPRDPGALRLVKYLSEIFAHGAIVLGRRRKSVGDKLDLRTEPLSTVKVVQYNMKTAMLVAFIAVLVCGFISAQTPAEQEVLQFERDACK